MHTVASLHTLILTLPPLPSAVTDFNVNRPELEEIFGETVGYSGGRFSWNVGGSSVVLRDSYEGYDVGPWSGTTINDSRKDGEWLDYVFTNLEVRERSDVDLESCKEGLPDEREGSDHIPVVVELQL